MASDRFEAALDGRAVTAASGHGHNQAAEHRRANEEKHTKTTLDHRVNARKREGDFIGIFGVFVTSGAECIGAVGVPGVGKCADTDRAPTCILRGLRGTKRSFA